MLLKLILKLRLKRLLHPVTLLPVAALFVLALGIILTWKMLPGGGDRYEVVIAESGFSPDRLEIRGGDTVSFVNRSARQTWPASDPHPTHEFLDGFDPLRPLNPNDRWDFTFFKAGEWGYHDHLLPHRRGSIVVRERSFAEKVQSLFFIRANKDEAPAGQSDAFPPEIAQLLQEKNKTIQAKIVRAMAEKYGPIAALRAMAKSGLPFTGETHLLVHEIGDVAYERYGKDALKYCDESFLSACYHGVVLHMLADHGMEGVAQTIERCREAGIRVFTQCAHAAGHGFLAWKDYHVLSALPLCDALEKLDSGIPVFNCYDGVFMENIFGVHDGGKPSPNRMVKADDPSYPCDAVPEKYRGGCWADQATLMVELFHGDLRKAAQHCDTVANPTYKEICYNNFARQIHPLTEGKTDRAVELCQNATGTWKDTCLIALISAAFSVGDQANMPYEICAYLSSRKSSRTDACYQNLFGIIGSYATGKAQQENFCLRVREDDRRRQCFRQFHLPDSGPTALSAFPHTDAATAAASAPDTAALKVMIGQKGAQAAYTYLKERWGTNPVAAHDLAHMVGRFAYDELGVQGFSVCDESFSFGCYHGLLEELIRQKGMAAIDAARNGCNALSPQGHIASCLHGIGHGVLAWKNALHPALQVCSSFASRESSYCADGVFMEYYTGIMQQNSAIRDQNASEPDVWNFCFAMPQEFQEQCVRNRALFLFYRSGNELASAIRACPKLSGELKNSCVRSTGLFATQRAHGSVDAAKKVCAELRDKNDYALCVSSAAQEFIFEKLPESSAQNLCEGLAVSAKQQCTQGIAEMLALYNS